MRVGSKSFWNGAVPLGAVLVAGIGCAAEDVSIGKESSAINLNRCYGENTRCSRTESTTAPEIVASPCDDEPVGTLEKEFEVPLDDARKLVVARDGTLWTIGTRYVDDGNNMRVSLSHFSAEGQLIASNDAAAVGESYVEADLAVDESGGAYIVTHYRSFDSTDKDEFREHTKVQRFGANADSLGAAIVVTGAASTQIVAGPGPNITLAGDAPNNAASGVVTRLAPDGEPLWIQNDVPSVGQGVGWGVSGLAVDAEGETTVLSERRRDHDADESTFGLSHYDADGNEVWSWTLPSAFAGGTSAEIVLGRGGNYVVAGETPGRQGRLIQSFSGDSTKRWAFELPSASKGFSVDPETGDTIVGSNDGIAVIDEEGTECRRFTRRIDGSLGGYESLVAFDGHIYYLSYSSFGRFEALPER